MLFLVELVPLAIGLLLITAYILYLSLKYLRTAPSPTVDPHPSRWTGDLKNTAYIFYQGMNASQAQAARYVETNTMVLTTQEEAVYLKTEVNTIPRERLWVYPEIQEIQRNTKLGLIGRVEHNAHGIYIRKNIGPLPYQPLYQTNEQGTLHHYSVNAAKSSLGQTTDILDHQRKYAALISAHPNINNIVLYGVSRGAATSFSALAEHQYRNVRLCILEGVPSSMSGIIKNYAARIPGLSRLGKFFYSEPIAHLFFGHQHVLDKSSQARGHVEHFPVDVPLVIISSHKDAVVPLENSIRLALRVAAHRLTSTNPNVQPVYFLQLDKVGHNEYTKQGSKDSQCYNNFIHAVYKKHGLPFVEQYAHEGEVELEKANLMSEPNRQLVHEQIKFWLNKPNRDQIRNRAFDQLVALKKDKKIDQNQLALYEQMPLFSKCDPSLYFFQRMPIREKFKALKEEEQTSSAQPH